MSVLNKSERVRIKTLQNCCRTFIWLGKMDRARSCLVLARIIYKGAYKRETDITKTLVA